MDRSCHGYEIMRFCSPPKAQKQFLSKKNAFIKFLSIVDVKYNLTIYINSLFSIKYLRTWKSFFRIVSMKFYFYFAKIILKFTLVSPSLFF